VLLAAVALAGCTSAGARIRDAKDIVHLDVSLGPQIGVSARVTHVFQAGVMCEGVRTGGDQEDYYYDTAHLAWNGRWCGVYKRIGYEGGIGPEKVEPKWYRRVYGAEYDEEYREQPRTPDEIGVQVGAVLGGVEVGFRPAELFDFILGFFGTDILKDDDKRDAVEDTETWVEDEEDTDGDRWNEEWWQSPPR